MIIKPFLLYITVFIFSFLSCANIAHGTTRDCKVIADSGSRLECFDSQKNTLSDDDDANDITDPLGETGKWRINKIRSETDGYWNVYISLQSNTPFKGRLGDFFYPSLNIYCDERETELYINWGFLVSSNDLPVSFVVDKQKIESEQWVISDDYMSTFYPRNVMNFIDRLIQASTFYASVSTVGEDSATANFNLSGLSEAIKPLRGACGW
ncbi:type VI secretion system-associated protein TagO [Serratia sp. (in: enterobacteria)]|uniref:type VI secretion system-associated protein TagO n=1 Tax=Serratia sp. (in: enterobacteria) TaxID=616 RepID=UPI003988FB53